MTDEYQKQVWHHNQEVVKAQGELMELAQRLSPGYWVLQYTYNSFNPKQEERYTAYVTNGDDNVTAHGRTLGGAIARLIGHLLDGGVFPLTGQYGRYIAEQDRAYVQERKRTENEKLLKVLRDAENCLTGSVRLDEADKVLPTLYLLRETVGELSDV